MTANGMDVQTQDKIVQQISSFALYGFPESHAASFALIAYASAYFKVKFLAAFTCAILNNQPMGFYSPAVLVKDAQRHGLRVKPIDIQVSAWECVVEHEPDGSLSMRMGLGYAKGLRKQAAEALLAARMQDGPFRSADDLALRAPELNRKELTLLARIGALNWVDEVAHRRDALWQVEWAGRPEGPLLIQNKSTRGRSQPAAPSNDDRRAAGSRLCGHWADGGQTPHALPAWRTSRTGHFIFRRFAALPRRRMGARGGLRYCAPATGNREGLHFYFHGRRDGNRQRHRDAGCV